MSLRSIADADIVVGAVVVLKANKGTLQAPVKITNVYPNDGEGYEGGEVRLSTGAFYTYLYLKNHYEVQDAV